MADRRGVAWAAGLAVAYGMVGWLRHRNHWSGGFDLSVFDHAVWRLSDGGGLRSAVLDRSILGDHLSPVLLLAVPLYAALPTVAWLFALQGVALGAAVVPARALARELGAPAAVATATVALSAPLLAASVFDFHPAVLATPLLGATLLGAVRDDPRLTMLGSIAIILCRADLVLLVIGVAIVRWNRSTKRALLVVPVGLLLTLVVPALVDSIDFWQTHYPGLGSGPTDALRHPWRLAEQLQAAGLGDKALIWLLPTGFLALARPRWAIGLAVGSLPALLSSWPGNALPWYHHAAVTVPFAAGGALEALGRRPADRRQLLLFALGAGISLSMAFQSPLARRAPDDLALPEVITEEQWPSLHVLLDQIAPGDAVSATNSVVPHVAHRREVAVWPAPFLPGIPLEHGVERDERLAAEIDIVIVLSVDRRYVEEFGFEIVDERDGLVLGRRPPGA